MKPLVTVGIVTYNSRDHLPECLDSVFEQTYESIEVVVWDNASQDDTVEWPGQTEYPVQVNVSDQNIGFGRAHNQLIKNASGTYYLALNPDVALEPDFISRLVDALQANDEFGWACGRMLYMKDNGARTTDVYSVGHALRKSGYAFNLKVGGSGEVFGANAAGVLYKREMLNDVADSADEYFDESFFLYYEDVDLDWRARLRGWKCLHDSDAVAYHVGDASHGRRSNAVIAQAQGNRILSVVKNAFLFDLIFYNIPRIIVRLLLDFIKDRRQAILIVNTVRSSLRAALIKRQTIVKRRRISYGEMQRWFARARTQDPDTSVGRVKGVMTADSSSNLD